jgi:hypothetical protein
MEEKEKKEEKEKREERGAARPEARAVPPAWPRSEAPGVVPPEVPDSVRVPQLGCQGSWGLGGTLPGTPAGASAPPPSQPAAAWPTWPRGGLPLVCPINCGR